MGSSWKMSKCCLFLCCYGFWNFFENCNMLIQCYFQYRLTLEWTNSSEAVRKHSLHHNTLWLCWLAPCRQLAKGNHVDINSHLFVSLNILLKCDCWITGGKHGLCAVTTGNKKTSVRFSRKGKVHPKMKFQSLSTHSHTEQKSDEISQSAKHFWSFTAKRGCSYRRNNWKRWRLVLLCEKQQKGSPEITNCFEKKLFTPLQLSSCTQVRRSEC